jgi:hypothetical protein
MRFRHMRTIARSALLFPLELITILGASSRRELELLLSCSLVIRPSMGHSLPVRWPCAELQAPLQRIDYAPRRNWLSTKFIY